MTQEKNDKLKRSPVVLMNALRIRVAFENNKDRKYLTEQQLWSSSGIVSKSDFLYAVEVTIEDDYLERDWNNDGALRIKK